MNSSLEFTEFFSYTTLIGLSVKRGYLGVNSTDGGNPYLQRFLSPDPFIISPTIAQDYNRYSYVLNNPLMYTDPSGYSRITSQEDAEAARAANQNYWNVYFRDMDHLFVGTGGSLGNSMLPFGYFGSLNESKNFIKFEQNITYNNGHWGYWSDSRSTGNVPYKYSEAELDFLKSIEFEGWALDPDQYEVVKKPRVWTPLTLPNSLNSLFSYTTRTLTGFGLVNQGRERLAWEILRQQRINRQLSRNFSTPINHSLRSIKNLGQALVYVNVGVTLLEFTTLKNKTWGAYGKLTIGLLSAGLTVVPEPITTSIGVVIGLIDGFGGFNEFYSSLDAQQEFYNLTGIVSLYQNNGPIYIKLK